MTDATEAATEAAAGGDIAFAGADDLDDLARIERDAFGDDAWSAASLAPLLSPAELDGMTGHLVLHVPESASAVFQIVADEAELLRIAVVRSARRAGLGRRLLDAGLGALRRRGIASCHLEVRADNAAAMALYRSAGFERTGLRRAYYRDGTDAVLLRRDLR